MDLDRHVAGFTAFADTHLNGEETNDYNIRLKREHSLHVLASLGFLNPSRRHRRVAQTQCEITQGESVDQFLVAWQRAVKAAFC